MSVTVTLSTPLQTHKGLVSTLTINEPSAQLFFDFGEPLKVRVVNLPDDQQRFEIDYNYSVLRKWIAYLCPEADEISINGLTVDDFYSVRKALTDIILRETGKNP